MNLISRCCHVMATGVHCQSPALKDTNYCYAHFRLSKRRHSAQAAARAREQANAREAAAARKRRDEFDFNFDFSAIKDRASFSVAVGLVMQALAANQITSRRAGHLLNGLQMMKGNLRD
jgi:hypothetical protein